MLPTEVDVIGYIASVCTTGASIPQVYKIWKTKSANDVSLAYMFTLTLGLCLWVVYGGLLMNMPLIVANVVAIFLNLLIISSKFYFDHKNRSAQNKSGTSETLCDVSVHSHISVPVNV